MREQEACVAGVELIVMLAMIAFNSIFAAYEIALAAVSAARLQVLVGENRNGARAALYMKENVEASLAAIQLGITLFGAVAAATGGAGAEEQIAPWLQRHWGLASAWAELLAVAAVVIPLTAVTITFGELVPKVFALRNKEWACLTLSPAMRWFTFSVWPAVWFFETVVSAVTDWGERQFQRATGKTKSEAAELQDLRAVAALARTSRLIGQREEGIILGAARLASRPVREIMLPAPAISMIDANAALADALIVAHLDMHTRFPVTERSSDPQGIIGYVNVKDIVAALRLSPQEASLRAIIRPLLSFHETETISACLERLLRDNAHIALVRKESESIAGLVTLEDIVEELLGDIKDEYDRPPAYATRSGTTWVVGGGISLARLRDRTGIDLGKDLPPTRAEVVSDWVTGHLGRPVRGGDIVERPGLRVVVRKVRRQQVLEAQVGRAE
jgi:putative hemolysin